MKAINLWFFIPLLALALVVSSCSKEEALLTGQLSFTSLLGDFEEGRLDGDFPECSENEPVTVCVSIADRNGAWVIDQTPNDDDDGLFGENDNIIEINIAPSSFVDLDNDGDWDSWFTEESESLELPAGIYSIEYFIVKDADGNEIYAAPREIDVDGIHIHNFVNDPLPISVRLNVGTKKYVDIEVLCYNEHFVYEFGYLFFDVTAIETQTVCIFGNVCDDRGMHLPAHFYFIVWEVDPNADDGRGEILFDGTNEYGVNDLGELYARPLCATLPDRADVEEEFFGEIYLIDPTGQRILIRAGVFSEAQIDAFYDPENPQYSHYWHFREGCESGDDEPILIPRPTSDEFFIDPRDGQRYPIVTIGNQTWMAANLNYAIPQDGSTNTYWWCYNYDPANCDIYGKLYNYEAAINACPEGWHLATENEWSELHNFLGGEGVAEAKMKSTGNIQDGTGLWNFPNDGTNESGFNALPSAYYAAYINFFYDLGESAWWYTTGEVTALRGPCFTLNNDNYFGLEDWPLSGAVSVRCVRD